MENSGEGAVPQGQPADSDVVVGERLEDMERVAKEITTQAFITALRDGSPPQHQQCDAAAAATASVPSASAAGTSTAASSAEASNPAEKREPPPELTEEQAKELVAAVEEVRKRRSGSTFTMFEWKVTWTMRARSATGDMVTNRRTRQPTCSAAAAPCGTSSPPASLSLTTALREPLSCAIL